MPSMDQVLAAIEEAAAQVPTPYFMERDKDVTGWAFMLGDENLQSVFGKPAVKNKKLGVYIWADDNRVHRGKDKPAVISEREQVYEWWSEGQRHRAGGKPAYVDNLNKVAEWWVAGKQHRDGDEPAIHCGGDLYVIGPENPQDRAYELGPWKSKEARDEWWKGGHRHRDGGKPAVVTKSGEMRWYVRGVPFRENDQPQVVLADGTQQWVDPSERLHRVGDLPAEIRSDGTMLWFQNGTRHRDGDEPAEVFADGTLKWYKNGELHRDGGKPAIINTDGTCMWFEYGEAQTPSTRMRKRAERHLADAKETWRGHFDGPIKGSLGEAEERIQVQVDWYANVLTDKLWALDHAPALIDKNSQLTGRIEAAMVNLENHPIMRGRLWLDETLDRGTPMDSALKELIVELETAVVEGYAEAQKTAYGYKPNPTAEEKRNALREAARAHELAGQVLAFRKDYQAAQDRADSLEATANDPATPAAAAATYAARAEQEREMVLKMESKLTEIEQLDREAKAADTQARLLELGAEKLRVSVSSRKSKELGTRGRFEIEGGQER